MPGHEIRAGDGLPTTARLISLHHDATSLACCRWPGASLSLGFRPDATSGTALALQGSRAGGGAHPQGFMRGGNIEECDSLGPHPADHSTPRSGRQAAFDDGLPRAAAASTIAVRRVTTLAVCNRAAKFRSDLPPLQKRAAHPLGACRTSIGSGELGKPQAKPPGFPKIASISDSIVFGPSRPQAPPQHPTCRELFQAPPETANLGTGLWRATRAVASGSRQASAPKAVFMVGADLKANVEGIDDETISKRWARPLWRSAFHRVRRSFEQTTAPHFTAGDTNECGVE